MPREKTAIRGVADDVESIEVRLVLEAIAARYGYDLRAYSSASMRRRVLAALSRSGLGSLAALQHAILRDPGLFVRVLDDLTIRVTELFRDPPFYRALRETVVPILRTYPLLRIWHAGCATGEEVYTTAILLSEAGLYDRAQIYATDISLTALARARQGTYPASDLPKFAENYARSGGTSDLSAYYTVAYDGIAMSEALRRNILFLQHDLVSDAVFGEMHVVFCRNVLIYFGRELRSHVLDKFAESLCPGGFLCLGSSERLPEEPRLAGRAARFSDFVREERIYRREG